jgi:hypothetical protein
MRSSLETRSEMHLANRILLLYGVLAAGITTHQTSGPGSDPPKIRGETVNGKPIELPEAATGKTTVLILGFSKQGGQQTGVWQDHLSQDFATDPYFTSYTIAMLEGVPTLFRGMIKSGIRSGTPAPKRDHVVTTVSGEAAWKKFAGVSDSSVPYLVLLDGAGHVRWSGHGLFDQRQYDVLRSAVKNVEAEAKRNEKPN